MVTENSILRRMALDSLKDKWGLAIGTFVIYMMLAGVLGFIPKLGPFASIFIAGPLALGIKMFSLSLSRDEEPRLEQIFDGFRNYGSALGTYLLMSLYIFLWMLLLIIPGIIASLSYSMTFFILADDPEIGASAALDKSRKMMDGFKWKYFYLQLSFLGWALLCILTIGIGFLWLFPYMEISYAKFYDDVKENYLNNPIYNPVAPVEETPHTETIINEPEVNEPTINENINPENI